MPQVQLFPVNGSNTAFYNTFATQLSKVLGGALCSTPLNTSVLDPSGQVGQAIFEGSALVDAKDSDSEGIIVAVPDVSGNDYSTKALYSGDIAVGSVGGPADKPLYVHDLSASSFDGKPNVKSMTFWLRTSGVDASLNIADDQTIFHAVTLPGDKNLKLRLKTSGATDDDRLAIADDNVATQFAAIQMNEVARTGAHAATYQLAPAVTKAEVSGKWNFFYVEFTTGIYPKEISWMADSAVTRLNSMLWISS